MPRNAMIGFFTFPAPYNILYYIPILRKFNVERIFHNYGYGNFLVNSFQFHVKLILNFLIIFLWIFC